MSENLARFGYTAREGEFLTLASLLSGYFLRRQFNEFIGRQCGALAQRLIERAVHLGHVRLVPALGSRVIYHVCASVLYSELGDSTNRNRREHRPATVRRRLMALDFAIAHAGRRWLLSERSKLDYLVNLGVLEADLPGMAIGSKQKQYFLERQPISITADGNLEFAFIDEGLRTLSQWELFLKSHRAPLNQLSGAEVVYAGCDAGRFRAAEKLFRRMVAGEAASGGTDVERLKRYFLARKLFEEKRYETFDQSRLDELREAKRVYAGESFEALYGHWWADGDGVFLGAQCTRAGFRTWCLPHFYEWLSPIQIPERRAGHAHYSIAGKENS